MESSSILKLGLFGGAAYLAYRYLYAPSSTTALAPASTAAASVVPPNPPKSLDTIYAGMLKAAAAEGVGADGAGVDAWNVYLTRAPGGPNPAPVPEDVFGSAIAGDSRNAKMTAATYWAGMAPYLKAKGGFAGLGLFGSLCCGRYA